jgi:NAD(P)-dependent dehydrogenase (short-subunit alcohol dehydrogenase family)
LIEFKEYTGGIAMVISKFGLKGEVALVTDAGRGLSKVIALALGEAGADVVVAGGNTSAFEQIAAEVHKLERKVLTVPADVTKPQQVQNIVQRALSEFGKIDILVNCAGIEFAKPLPKVAEEEWHRVIDTNLTSVFLCSKAVGKHMLGQQKGRIVNMASGLARRGVSNSAVYCAAMGGIMQFTRALAIEWARENITVNGIGPGWFSEKVMSKEEAEKDPLIRYIPLRRKGQPTDLAALVVYLSSDAGSYVTGQTFFIDGGLMAHG